MTEINWVIDVNNSTTSCNLDKRLCRNYGEMCELATDFGYCQITACIKHREVKNEASHKVVERWNKYGAETLLGNRTEPPKEDK